MNFLGADNADGGKIPQKWAASTPNLSPNPKQRKVEANIGPSGHIGGNFGPSGHIGGQLGQIDKSLLSGVDKIAAIKMKSESLQVVKKLVFD